MIAQALVSMGLDAVTVEELHYGKLVVSRHGPVPAGQGYATTFRTTGFIHPDRVLPAKLLDGGLLQPDHVEAAFETRGALYVRLVNNTLVAMRVRFRAESGEGRSGRKYLQACCRQVTAPRGFSDVPPGFLPWAGGMEAEPDLAKRLDARAIETDFGPTPALTEEALEAWSPSRRIRVAAIVQALRGAARVLLGRDLFDGPDRPNDDFVQDFLTDVELALMLMRQAGEAVSRDIRIACGLPADIAGRALRLTSVERSSAPSEIRWRDLLEMVAVAREPPPSARRETRPDPGRGSFSRRASTGAPTSPTPRAPGERMFARGAPERLPADAGTSSRGLQRTTFVSLRDRDRRSDASVAGPGVHPPPARQDGAALGLAGAAQVSPIRPRKKAGEILDQFRRKFVEAKSDTRPLATIELFDIAADEETHEALCDWDPFDVERPPPADVLLGLLLGLYVPRNDLLENFTLLEFLSICAQLDNMPAGSGRKGWVKRLGQRVDMRMGRICALTLHESSLVREYFARFKVEMPLSPKTSRMFIKDWEYYSYSTQTILLERRAFEGAESALARMRERYRSLDADPTDQLIFATSGVPSIFGIPSRRYVADESRNLLARELEQRQIHADFGRRSPT